MAHSRRDVIWRAMREYEKLDKLVAHLSDKEWKRKVPRPETKDPWTVKDVLAHIAYWKSGVARSARGQRREPWNPTATVNEENRRVFLRFRRRSPKEVLEYHRQVQIDLLAAIREAPKAWFTRKRGADWPFDLDGHSANHRIKDLEAVLTSQETVKARRRQR